MNRVRRGILVSVLTSAEQLELKVLLVTGHTFPVDDCDGNVIPEKWP